MGPIRNPNWSTSGMRATLSYLGGWDEHTYTTDQLKSAKSTTYQALQN